MTDTAAPTRNALPWLWLSAALVGVDYAALPAALDPDAAHGPVIHPELGDNVLYETRLASGDVLARRGDRGAQHARRVAR